MMTIGFVTCREIAHLTEQDRRLADAFRSHGIRVDPVVWSNPDIDWRKLDVLIIRSCWDYHRHVKEFLEWVSQIEKLKIPLYNSAQIVRWNHHKDYLKQLSEVGANLIPTRWFEAGEQPHLVQLMRKRNWEEIIIKPSVGATAYKTYRLDMTAAKNHHWDHHYPHGFLVQKFQPEIYSGEWSLVFFGGRYSHAVLKQPRAGDYRVQSDFGGSRELRDPKADIIAQCRNILELCPQKPLFARIDGIETEGVFYLMEVELIEPELYIFNDELAEKFVKAFRG